MKVEVPREVAAIFALLLFVSTICRILRLHYIVYTLTLILLWAYLGQCWNILYGYAGQLSFGHAAFFGLGAYASSLLFTNYGITPWIGMFAGGALAAFLALIMGYPTLKLRGAYFALATIAVAEMVRLLTLKLDRITNGPLGIILPITRSVAYMQFSDTFHWFLLAYVMLFLLSMLSHRIEESRLGAAFRMIGQDEDAAASVGIDVFRYKMIALLLSAYLTGVGGTFFAQLTGYIRPDIVLTPERSDEILIIAVVGGVGTFIGPIIGSMILILLRQTIFAMLGGGYAGVHLIVYGLLIITVVRFMPEGIYQYLKRAAGKYLAA